MAHICTIVACMRPISRSSRPHHDYAVAVRDSTSAAGALRILGLAAAGGNYVTLNDKIRELRLNTSHWLGQGHLRGRVNPHVPKIPLEEILIEESRYRGGTSLLRSRLVRERIFENRCSQCSITQWKGKEISLHLDHINGNRIDNRTENLRLLCPNCHSQTETYCGRNKRLKRALRLSY